MQHQVTTSTTDRFQRASKPCFVHVHAMTTTAILLGALTTVGCSSPPEPDRTDSAQFEGTVTLLNLTNEMHSITIDPLSTSVSIDCDAIEADPEAMLSDSLFQDPLTQSYTIPLFSGEELAVDPAEWQNNWDAPFNRRSCQAFRITSPSLNDIIVFYNDQWTRKPYYHNIDLDPDLAPDDQTIVIEADYSNVQDPKTLHSWREITCPLLEDEGWWAPLEFEWDTCAQLTPAEQIEAARVPPGTRYSWRTVNNDVPLHFERSRAEEGTAIRIPARCRVPDAGEGLFWEEFRFVLRDLQLRAIDIGRDGCHTLNLYSESYEEERGDGNIDWLLCAPYETISPLLGTPEARLQIEEGGEDFLRISVIDHPRIEEVVFTRGDQLSSFYDVSWDYEVRQGCAPVPTTCDEVTLPIDLRLTSSRNQLVVPGESVDVGYGAFHLVRAAYTPVINAACEGRDPFFVGFDEAEFAPFVEAVLILEK